MHKATLYQKANGMQRRDAQLVLEEYAHLIQWKEDGKDSLLDVGCGSADITIEFILPLMPSTFSKLVGSDISDHMVRYAKDNYKHPRIFFEQMDIAKDLITDCTRFGDKYDHITSFYCLHWVQNQRMAISNIYNLLDNNGDCLLTFLVRNPIFEIYNKMAKTVKWSKYMNDVNRFISPYQYSERPEEEFSECLLNAGFSEYTVQIKDSLYIFENVDVLKRSVAAVNPFLERMPIDLREEFLNDYVSVVTNMNLSLEYDSENGIPDHEYKKKFLTPYQLIVAYARK